MKIREKRKQRKKPYFRNAEDKTVRKLNRI